MFAAAGAMEELYYAGKGQHPAIGAIERGCDKFVRLRSLNAKGQARIDAFKEIVKTARDESGDCADCQSAPIICERLAKEEVAGRWSAEPYLNPDCPF